ncbi:hypothetical protein GCM10017774_15940 [Lentzea cavernae]|uniref:Uncharacterized protein n=1 Tax=Lentzea cavernae TaxID=2020703 RepID=A0ABQ3MB93_9PSEU|nr:hypothetical protein GCM10017774_15940 [Lentzea cavernae]
MTGIAVTRNGVELENPHLATIEIENSGSHAITSGQYDQDRPITINLGAAVIEVFKASYARGTASIPFKHSANGNQIHLGPDVLPKKAVLTLQILTSGKPVLGPISEHLGDVKIISLTENQLATAPRRNSKRSIWYTALAIVLAAALGIWIASVFSTGTQGPPSISISSTPRGDKDEVPEGSAMKITGIGFLRNESLSFIVFDGEDALLEGHGFISDLRGTFSWGITAPQSEEINAAGPTKARSMSLRIIRSDGSTIAAPFTLLGS